MAESTNYDNREKVMAKGGYQSEPKSGGYGNDILGILISVGLIFGGLSGRMVLRGTNSSPALVVAGFAFLAWDIISMVRRRSALQKAEAEYDVFCTRRYEVEKQVGKDDRPMASQANVRIAYEKGLSMLDFGPRLNGITMTRDANALAYTASTGRVHNIITFSNLDLTVIFDADPNASELAFDLIRDKSGFGIALPENVTLVQEQNA